MRRFVVIASFFALLTGALAACAGGPDYGESNGGGSSGGGSTLSMSSSGFSGATSITVTAGQAVTFDDSSGGTHDLVTGTSGQFTAETGAPDEFSTKEGLDLSAGDKKTVTFNTAGTYHITCTIHPSMQATVTVNAASGYGY
ncbi:MAG TPA: plastocyanin/azurin family copper-binding protein [Ktedonobacterales bacterium]